MAGKRRERQHSWRKKFRPCSGPYTRPEPQDHQEHTRSLGLDLRSSLGVPLTPPRNKRLSILPNVTMSPDLHSSFKLGVYRGQEEATKGKNFVYSPLSIRAALGLMAGLLDGENQRSLLSLVGCSTLGDLNRTSGSLIRACRPSNNETMLKISFANGVWADLKQTLEPSFLETSESIYKAFVNQVHFKTKYREVRKEINDWIEKETGGLIKSFLPENNPNKRTRFVLANALYFKGTWDRGFDIKETKFDDFSLLDGITRVKVPFMTCYSRYELYFSANGFKSLMLPYQMDDKEERHLSLHIILPEKKHGLIKLAKKMASDPSFFDNLLAKKKTELSLIKIPKFKISFKFDATEALKKMGLNIDSINTNDGAPVPDCMETFHGATIEVDERGTTAAATTYSHFSITDCIDPPRPPPETFVVDHPFIYAIREDMSGAILFFGHVANPSLD